MSDLAKLLAQLAEMQDQIRNLQQKQPSQFGVVGDDYYALDPTALNGNVVERGKYKMLRPTGTTAEPFEADWQQLFIASPFIEIPLKQKRQEIGRYLRFTGVAVKPDWFDKVVSKEVHNAGVQARIEGLQREIEAWKRSLEA